tara:strand:- start:275975 stop:277093 length:1119 start_codon:yes stop_codon:yes gene_type:complete
MNSPVSRIAMALVFLMGTNCLKIEKRLDPSAILSALGGNSYFLFLSDQPNGGSPRTLLTYRTDGTLQLQSWNGGPGNIIKGVVANGVIFALDGSTNDTIWMSRDQGNTWESWTNSTPQSSAFQRLAACNGTVIATYANISTDAVQTPQGYFSTDGGSSFSNFHVASGSTSPVPVRGLDCNSTHAFVAVGSANYISRALLTNLTSWEQPPTHPSVHSFYTGIVASDTGLVGIASSTELRINYSTDRGNAMTNAGYFPLGSQYVNGGDFGNNRYRIAVAQNSPSVLCRVYTTSSGSEDPNTQLTPNDLSCGSSTDMAIPAMLVDSNRILFSYRFNGQASTGLYFSADDGANFTNVDLSSVWTSSGYITSIARAR